jgi:hypothetical protein
VLRVREAKEGCTSLKCRSLLHRSLHGTGLGTRDCLGWGQVLLKLLRVHNSARHQGAQMSQTKQRSPHEGKVTPILKTKAKDTKYLVYKHY